MTNFELNKLLAELLDNKNVYEKYGELFNTSNPLNVTRYNPCENWNDLMPIAIKMGNIDIENFGFGCLASIRTPFGFYTETGDTEQIALVKCCIAVLEGKESK